MDSIKVRMAIAIIAYLGITLVPLSMMVWLDFPFWLNMFMSILWGYYIGPDYLNPLGRWVWKHKNDNDNAR